MASEDNRNISGLELELAKLRAEFNLFRQDVKKNEYSKLIVFLKDVLFKGTTKTERNGVQYNLAPDYVELIGTTGDAVDTTSTWEDWDISSYIPVNAIRAEILIANRFDTNYVAGIRQNGSALDKLNHIDNDSQYKVVVNLDSNRIIERYADNANVTFYVTGYYI